MRNFAVPSMSVFFIGGHMQNVIENDLAMGVDHGDAGDNSLEFGVGDANANCPPQIFVI